MIVRNLQIMHRHANSPECGHSHLFAEQAP